uniref:Leucine-rich repeat-containing N-terminal plant-type domain-containing protein n=1 Tax=Ananas comosus var. bracteatus TaxID=296719 RepID=A0A6V7PE85_ANACO|nr:unnamed protein product [Ananas comosus var. bracteatus]
MNECFTSTGGREGGREGEGDSAAALSSLASQWRRKPSDWVGSDPCGDIWIGINCTDSRIVSIKLSSMGLSGTLSDDIQYIEELQTLDLSYNKGLSGGLHASIGRLSKLENLLLTGCSFSGEIPPEIGLLSRLVYLMAPALSGCSEHEGQW